MGVFRFKRFAVCQDQSALKIGTDAVLLGAAMTIKPTDKYILDIGTGTGVIALMASQRLGDLLSEAKDKQRNIASQQDSIAEIDAVEIDPLSAQEASQNFFSSPWANWLKCYPLNLKDFHPQKQYDLIFSNPPYYDNSLVNPDKRLTQAKHSDSLSYREICAFTSEYLNLKGRLSIILPSETESTLIRTAASFGLFPFRILRIKTTSKKAPKRFIMEFSRERNTVLEESLVLQGDSLERSNSNRSEQYSALTKDFYL